MIKYVVMNLKTGDCETMTKTELKGAALVPSHITKIENIIKHPNFLKRYHFVMEIETYPKKFDELELM